MLDRELRCYGITELLSPYLDGQVSEDERRQVEEHLPRCARCGRELQELRVTVQALRDLPVIAMPRSFALAAQPRTLPTFFPYLRNATFALAAMVLTMFVASLYVQMTSVSSMPQPKDAVAVQQVESFSAVASPTSRELEKLDAQPALPAPALAPGPMSAAPRAPSGAPAPSAAAKQPQDEANNEVQKAPDTAETGTALVPQRATTAGGGVSEKVPSSGDGDEKSAPPANSAQQAPPQWPLLEIEIGAFILLLILGGATLAVFWKERRGT
ncbi:MAG: zf-HC2 domain-containing protein [Chloroflexi bacterium]|nr:zf-HC2 domain-containing protein [Chloroflexota bacterium]